MENPEFTALKVYTEKDISIGTFFGGPLASAILISKNYKTFGKEDSARNALYLGIILSILLLLIIFLLPDSIPDKLLNFSLPLIFAGIVCLITHKYQKKDIDEYLTKGVPKASAWGAFGIGIMSSAIYLIILFPIALLSIPDFDDKMYDNYVTVFVNNEKAALSVYDAFQNQSIESIIPITEESINLWEKNIEIVESMEAIKNLPNVLREQNKLLIKYCTLRIEELSLIKQALAEETNKYDSKIFDKQEEIETVLSDLESYK